MSVSSATIIFAWRQFSALFYYHLRVKLNRKEFIESGVGLELEKKILGKACNYEVCHFCFSGTLMENEHTSKLNSIHCKISKKASGQMSFIE